MVDQLEHHPRLQRESLQKFCKENGILFEAYTSLGDGKVRLFRLARLVLDFVFVCEASLGSICSCSLLALSVPQACEQREDSSDR